MRINLRPYQRESVERACASLERGEHPLIVLPTGSGKSLVLAETLRILNMRALVLTHVKELLVQNSKALSRVAPDISQGYFAAGLKEKDPFSQVVFGSVQSVVRSLEQFRLARKLVIIDEAHLCPRKSTAMYSQVFSHFMGAQRLGLTATPKRLDSGSLIDGDSAWFSEVAHEEDVRKLVTAGYLLPLVGVVTELQADLAGVGSRGGEFIAEQAAAAVQRTLPLQEAVAKTCRYARKRKHWLIFAASVEHAEDVARELAANGVSAGVVTAKTPDAEREATIEDFRAGHIRALVNVGVLTTGFDAPCTDAIICYRPTQSDILWQQILGRGMRLAEGKQNCLLLDFVGNLDRLGGVGCIVETFDMRQPEQVAKAREKAKPKRKTRDARAAPDLYDPSSEDPMRNGTAFEAAVVKIDGFVIPSRKFPGTELVCLTYELEDESGRPFSAKEFLCVEYGKGARHLAGRWFARRGLTMSQVPLKARDSLALARVLEEPVEVVTRFDPRLGFYKIEAERFALHSAEAAAEVASA